jgi:hypothetical protein
MPKHKKHKRLKLNKLFQRVRFKRQKARFKRLKPLLNDVIISYTSEDIHTARKLSYAEILIPLLYF